MEVGNSSLTQTLKEPKCHQGSVSLAKCTHGLSLRRPTGAGMGRGLADIPPLGRAPCLPRAVKFVQ